MIMMNVKRTSKKRIESNEFREINRGVWDRKISQWGRIESLHRESLSVNGNVRKYYNRMNVWVVALGLTGDLICVKGYIGRWFS